MTQSPQQCRHWQFTAAVNLDVNRAISRRFKLQPGTTTWDHLGTVIVTTSHGVSGKEHTGRADQLANHHALRTVDDKGAALSHPWIIAEVDFLLLDFTRDFVSQFNGCVQWRFKRQIVFLGKLVGGLWLVKMIAAEPQCQLLTSIVVNWVNF